MPLAIETYLVRLGVVWCGVVRHGVMLGRPYAKAHLLFRLVARPIPQVPATIFSLLVITVGVGRHERFGVDGWAVSASRDNLNEDKRMEGVGTQRVRGMRWWRLEAGRRVLAQPRDHFLALHTCSWSATPIMYLGSK